MVTPFAQTLTPTLVSEHVHSALMRPDVYGGIARWVEVRETLISWVLLAGDRAFKLKKPVVLPFLDYGRPSDEARCVTRRFAGPGAVANLRRVPGHRHSRRLRLGSP